MKQLLCLIAFLGLSQTTFANETRQALAWDLGVLALALHDLRAQESERQLANIEDSRFNLSTLFDATDGRGVEDLGHQKNTFNTISTSAAKYFADFYWAELESLEKLMGVSATVEMENRAREETVKHFILHIKQSFERVTGLNFPRETVDGEITNRETIVTLMGHDLLPGTLLAFDSNGESLDLDKDGEADVYAVADRSLDEMILNHYELMQPVDSYDGIYDEAFKSFERKRDGAPLDLQKIDRFVIAMLEPSFPYDETLKTLQETKSIKGTLLEPAWLSVMAKGISPVRNSEPVAFVPTDLSFLDSL